MTDTGGAGDAAGGTGGRSGGGSGEEPFIAHRRLLFDAAYRMLGSVADAEDVLQDAWVKWSGVDRSTVTHPRAYLLRTITNLSLNKLTSARAVRETYVGPWLPEPLLTGPDVAEAAETADSVSMAMLVVMESLSPLERAVFVLREVFGYSHAEIAEALDRGEAAVRQTARRAREHVQAGRPRYDADPVARKLVTEKFLAACSGGDLNAVMELLAPDVTLWSDGGGRVSAARRPVHGANGVARWMLGVLTKPELHGVVLELAEINGSGGVLASAGGHPMGAVTFELVDGLIQDLRFQVNPDKLRGLTQGTKRISG